MAHPPIEPVIEEYLSLALSIGRRSPGFAEGYVGPPEIERAVDERGLPKVAELLGRAEALRRAIETAPIALSRRRFLSAQMRAMVMMVRKLTGESVSYTEEVAALFDIVPAPTPESVFQGAIDDLDDALPGSGDVGARLAAWRDRTVVTPSVALDLLARIATEARRRTVELVTLPTDESVTFELVTQQPWGAYNRFLGNGASQIAINADLPIRASSLLDLVTHEAYLGHHTEHTLKERTLYRGNGYAEYAVQLTNVPECVISEGIATRSAEILFPDGAAERWLADAIYPLIGLQIDPDHERRISAAVGALRAVGANAALLMHEAGASDDEVVAYHRRYGLDDAERARRRLAFLKDPLWRAYSFCYHTGHDLVEAWLAEATVERASRLHTLLHDQITPGLIASWVMSNASTDMAPPPS